ncbi:MULTISPECIES: hypothetical protein [Sphingobacterium]|uniref:hypothetical protein n=1 Tax=Sphingobacterium TaxID=28453 RepID=UPI00257F7ECB|nr:MULTISPECIES: hypothetical protein [Sphingobacterium]
MSDLIGQKEPSVRFHCCWCLQSHEGFEHGIALSIKFRLLLSAAPDELGTACRPDTGH